MCKVYDLPHPLYLPPILINFLLENICDWTPPTNLKTHNLKKKASLCCCSKTTVLEESSFTVLIDNGGSIKRNYQWKSLNHLTCSIHCVMFYLLLIILDAGKIAVMLTHLELSQSKYHNYQRIFFHMWANSKIKEHCGDIE